ncbi:MAG TPA: germacradienol/geosmin synthase [Pseudonocardiaceae bacterium]|nr:germacradienol/geosmin synthase [Pseudonocardiaceae bacterium]
MSQPFELPEFYMPYPARLNPHVQSARLHSRVWAQEMGILGSEHSVWSEQMFDSMDLALLSSYTHPEALEPVLHTVTDWYVWVFYIDDHFLEVFKRGGDMAGAQAHLDRMPLFMPVELRDGMPEPANPVERSLGDVWQRTASVMSAAWRRRCHDSNRQYMEQGLIWELANINQNRIANPIEYMENRRNAGGGRWSAAIVEYAINAEVPEVVFGTRPIRVLTDTFADQVHLRNDIFSYQREIEEEDEINNAVLVAERFFGYPAQRCAEIVNDVITSRAHQFETTALAELPVLFEEFGLDPGDRARILGYVKGLQDWQAGGHEWHLQSSRYMNAQPPRPSLRRFLAGPTGLGTSAARITSFQQTFTRPDIVMPFAVRENPHEHAAREHVTAWAQRMRMIDSIIWDERGFGAADYGLFAALTHPDADREQLELIADWHVWGFYFDDLFAAEFKRSRNLAGARAFLARLPAFMTASPPAPLNPVERGLADLWARTSRMMSVALLDRFPRAVMEFVGSWLWELYNLILDRTPDPVDYIEMRRRTGGAEFSITLAAHLLAEHIPAKVFTTPPMRALALTFADIGPLRNDLFSYEKEIEREFDINNGVLVIQRFLGCGLQHAADVLNDLTSARLAQFQLAATELATFTLDTQAERALGNYVRYLQHWMAGDLAWSLVTGRYESHSVVRR